MGFHPPRMIIGVPKEVKPGERRVGLTPAGARELAASGHQVQVESGAGVGAGFADAEYAASGAHIAANAHAAYAADLVVKVKELQAGELTLLTPGSTVFCYHHLQAAPEMVAALRAERVCAIAYELVEDANGALPLLAPMSAIAGELAVLAGAHYLQLPQGGNGCLLSRGGSVAIVGAGVAGRAAARMALSLGARVQVLVRDPGTVRIEARRDGDSIQVSPIAALHACLASTDLLISAVNVRAAPTPKLLTRQDLAGMRTGSVLVEISIDGGGIGETSRPTSHEQPTYVEAGVIHYCVANMPAAVPVSATLALTEATLPYLLALAQHGTTLACARDAGLAHGLCVAP